MQIQAGVWDRKMAPAQKTKRAKRTVLKSVAVVTECRPDGA